MSYYFSKKIKENFNQGEKKIRETLKKEGFGVLTEIDVQKTLKKKLNINFRRYKILGACNPSFAYQSLQAEDKIGTMLPCNVILQEVNSKEIEVAAVDPIASMRAVSNQNLLGIAQKVRRKLKGIVESL